MTETTEQMPTSIVQAETPYTVTFPENPRNFMPEIELSEYVYAWTNSMGHLVVVGADDDGKAKYAYGQIINPWESTDFPVQMSLNQRVKAWYLRFHNLQTNQTTCEQQNREMDLDLAMEFDAMKAAEYTRTLLVGKDGMNENQAKALGFLRTMLTDLGEELRDEAVSNDWCAEYDDKIDVFCERQYKRLRELGINIGWNHIQDFSDAAHREEEVEVNATVVITTRKTVSVTVTRRHGDDDISSEVEEAVESELDGSGSYYGYDRYDSEWEMEDYEVQ